MIPLAAALALAASAPQSTLPLRLKTNAIVWAAAIPNVEPEFLFKSRFSLSIPVGWAPWFISKSFAPRVLMLQPEFRFWLGNGFSGHFFGLHASAAWFNLRCGNFRYQDSGRPLLGAGISYGYTLRISRRWLLEFSAGAGYASMRYQRFRNTDNGTLIDTRQTSYWGLDHLAVSIAYSFNL